MIHIMLGPYFGDAICKLKGYVLNYEDRAIAQYFKGIVCSEEKDGTLIFKTAESYTPNSGGVLRFNSEPDDSFSVRLSSKYDIFGPDKQNAYLQNYFATMFDQAINLEEGEQFNQLNITLYLPLYDTSYWEVAKRLIKAISEQKRRINVDLFFLTSDIAYLFTDTEKLEQLPTLLPEYQKLAQKTIKEAVDFKEHSKDAEKLGHIIVMQNCNSEGRSLNLDWDSFTRILGEYVIATVNSYPEVFSPNAEIEGRPIHAFGLSVLNLDKFYYVRYLLSRAYVTILKREGVDITDVDIAEYSAKVQKLLIEDNKRYKVYDHIYDHRVKGYLATSAKTDEEIMTQARRDIDTDIDEFVSAITSFMNDDNISLPAKRVTLAQLLGLDDELMSGDMFQPDQLLFRDCYTDCIDMFVKANNALLNTEPTHLFVTIPSAPVEDSSEEIDEDEEPQKDGKNKHADEDDERKYPKEFADYAMLLDSPIDFQGLIKDLKGYDIKIRRQTEYIRTLQKELENCNVQIQQSEEKSKVLKEDGFHYGDDTFQLDPIEVIPLEKTFVPQNGKLPPSVSLREAFPPVRNQGPLGSCTIFTMTGIFEYILKNSKNSSFSSEIDLSERFLYYNTRIAALEREGKPLDNLENTGTSFYDAIGCLSHQGICKEPLCPYVESIDEANQRPSEEAYNEAKSRLVVEAKNVELKEDHIKAALNEGYPVAIAVHLYSEFGASGTGFTPMPSEEEIANPGENQGMHRSHAMIICGYSDENKVFVVRNSWGTDFGNHGYCYLPYSYVTDERITLQACIITEVNTGRTGSQSKKESVQFDRMNPEINSAIIKNLIGEAQAEKTLLLKERMNLYAIFTLIEKKVVSPDIRHQLYSGTKQRLEWELAHINRQKEKNESAKDVRMELHNKKRNEFLIKCGIAFLVLVALLVVYLTVDVINMFIPGRIVLNAYLIAIATSLIIIGFWCYSHIKERKAIMKEYAEINAQLEEYEHLRRHGDASNLGLYLDKLNIRMFMPWLVVRKLSDSQYKLTQKYQMMVAFTNNLKEWYDVECNKVSTMTPETRTPFISLLTNETLDAYYERNAEEITRGLRLSTLFHQGFGIEDEAIVQFQNKLKNTIIATLDDSLSDFSVYKYITGQSRFEFARPVDGSVEKMLSELERKSAVYVRIGASANDFDAINSVTRLMMSYDIEDDLTTWNEQFAKNFTIPPFQLRIPSPFKLSFLQMKRYPLEECEDLYDNSTRN